MNKIVKIGVCGDKLLGFFELHCGRLGKRWVCIWDIKPTWLLCDKKYINNYE